MMPRAFLKAHSSEEIMEVFALRALDAEAYEAGASQDAFRDVELEG